MKYISGIYALNLPCSLETCGDWHCSAIDWTKVPLYESNDRIYGDYGIERNREVWDNEGRFNVANHIRALLDLIADGQFAAAQGMRNDFVCNDKYTPEIFEKVALLKKQENWPGIDKFMGREYLMQWIGFKRQTDL